MVSADFKHSNPHTRYLRDSPAGGAELDVRGRAERDGPLVPFLASTFIAPSPPHRF